MTSFSDGGIGTAVSRPRHLLLLHLLLHLDERVLPAESEDGRVASVSLRTAGHPE